MDLHPIQGEVEILLVTSATETGISAGLVGRLGHAYALLSCRLLLFQNECLCLMFDMKMT